jgi:hypothetical protein
MERLTLRIFFFCMPFCAALALASIWFGGPAWPGWLFKHIPTAFILGLANFLTWFVLIMRRIAAR